MRDGLDRSDDGRVSASRILFGAYGSGGLAGESDEALIDALLTLTRRHSGGYAALHTVGHACGVAFDFSAVGAAHAPRRRTSALGEAARRTALPFFASFGWYSPAPPVLNLMDRVNNNRMPSISKALFDKARW
jgi:hypothetical protein